MLGHSWRNKNELINDVLLRKPLLGRAIVRRKTKTCISNLCTDAMCIREENVENQYEKKNIYMDISDDKLKAGMTVHEIRMGDF